MSSSAQPSPDPARRTAAAATAAAAAAASTTTFVPRRAGAQAPRRLVVDKGAGKGIGSGGPKGGCWKCGGTHYESQCPTGSAQANSLTTAFNLGSLSEVQEEVDIVDSETEEFAEAMSQWAEKSQRYRQGEIDEAPCPWTCPGHGKKCQ